MHGRDKRTRQRYVAEAKQRVSAKRIVEPGHFEKHWNRLARGSTCCDLVVHKPTKTETREFELNQKEPSKN